jgi:magnesium-transporting ATPase (P-type)
MIRILPLPLIVIICFCFSFLLFISFTPYGVKVEQLQENYLIIKLSFILLGMVSVISVFLLWGLMLYHWGNKNFEKKKDKLKWFLIMVFLQWVGAILYYFRVVRRERK